MSNCFFKVLSVITATFIQSRRLTFFMVGAFFLIGCSSTVYRASNDTPSFNKGLDALNKKDFSQASFYFAELAKEGDPAAMNNLGVALMMVDREDEAIYWFKSAARYGNTNAPETLRRLGETVPEPDMIGKHQSVVNSKLMEDIVVTTIVGVALGVSLHYSLKNSGTSVANYNPWSNHNTKNATSSGIPTYSRRSTPECNSDYDCGIGFKCIKARYETTGSCMKSVDKYGVQQNNMPESSSILMRKKSDSDCRFDTDCPIGFHCDEKYEVCVKDNN